MKATCAASAACAAARVLLFFGAVPLIRHGVPWAGGVEVRIFAREVNPPDGHVQTHLFATLGLDPGEPVVAEVVHMRRRLLPARRMQLGDCGYRRPCTGSDAGAECRSFHAVLQRRCLSTSPKVGRAGGAPDAARGGRPVSTALQVTACADGCARRLRNSGSLSRTPDGSPGGAGEFARLQTIPLTSRGGSCHPHRWHVSC